MSLINNCGNLHIRTALNDPDLSPNAITQLIVGTGLRIGVVPESNVKSDYYKFIVKNQLQQIILETSNIQYLGVGNYIYFIIPFNAIPNIGDTISIQIISDKNCTFLSYYEVQSYILPNFESNSTTIKVNGVLEKYIKIKPTISTGGFDVDTNYYYKCDSSNQSDEECFIKFKNDKNLSKILDKLPSTNIQICPPILDWNFSDMICITPIPTTTVKTCMLEINGLINYSGSVYRVSHSHSQVTSFDWTVYNNSDTKLISGSVLNISGSYTDLNFGNLGVGTFVLKLVPTDCVSDITKSTRQFSVTTDSSTTIAPIIYNVVPDLSIIDETYWNHFNPEKIPDFEIPVRRDFDNKFVPNKWLFYHSFQGLSKFGSSSILQLTKLFKKGFTHINVDSLPIYETNLESIVTGDRLIGDTKTFTNDDSYINFKNFVTNSFIFADTYKVTKTDNKLNLFANFIDYQGRLGSAQTQESTNYLVTGLYSALEKTNGRFGYTKLSYNNSGGYITSDTYLQGNSFGFIGYSDNTVENGYKNKSLKDSSKLLIGAEQTYFYETLLPQNYQVKDQTDTNWFLINHFGGEATNTVGVGQTPNSEHWASQIAGNTQNLYNRAKVFGQDLIMTLKPTCDRGETYLHSEPLSIYRNGKYIKEWNRYSNTLFNINNGTTYISNFETEVVTNFVAEGQIILAYFAGARGVNFVSNYITKELVPRIKVSNLKKGTRYDNPTIGNQDYEPYVYTMKAMWRLAQKVTVAPNIAYSFLDICDGNEIYLNIDTEVSYDGGTNFLKQRALDWQINQKSPVLAVVNLEKNIIAICALQAYGVEQDSATIRYNKNGRNFQQTISIPANKISIYMFDLGQSI